MYRPGQLVLVDAGGVRYSYAELGENPLLIILSQEYGGYIADITRTWPVTGSFTPAQKDLYNAVLSVQRSCIALCRASAIISLDKLHAIAENLLKEQLTQLGFDMSGQVIYLF